MELLSLQITWETNEFLNKSSYHAFAINQCDKLTLQAQRNLVQFTKNPVEIAYVRLLRLNFVGLIRVAHEVKARGAIPLAELRGCNIFIVNDDSSHPASHSSSKAIFYHPLYSQSFLGHETQPTRSIQSFR